MIFRTIAFLSALNAASAGKSVEIPTGDISASSKLGTRILSGARQLDGDNFSWIAGYSLRFEKCATSDEYYGGYFGGDENGGNNNNNNNDRQNYNGMYKQRLVHFKLCPADECSSSSSCTNGADYVVDMNVFVEAYIESKLDAQEYNCEMVRENCYNDDEYQCYVNAGLDYCDNDNNNNNNNNNAVEFQLEDAMECTEMEVDEDALQYYYYNQGGDSQQQYNNANYYNQNNNQNQEMKLFVGPYCSANGKSIFLGTFMDETCSYPAPSGTYESFSYGAALPYSQESLVANSCLSCKEPQDADDQNDGDQDDEDEVLEVCERLYEDAGKCESGLADGVTYYPNTYACTLIQSLKAPGKMNSTRSSIAASKVFAGLFAATTAVFAGVAYYLYHKSRRQNVHLSSNDGGTLA